VDANSDLGQLNNSTSSELPATADGDMTAFISGLIEQNAELIQKVNELSSQKKLVDDTLAEANQKAEVIRLQAKEEINIRVESTIREAEEKAKAESLRMVAEATRQAEAIKALTEKQTSEKTATTIRESEAKARMEADRIIAEAKKQAQAIIEEETKKAQQYGLLILDKAREKAVSILEEANAQILALANRSGQKVKRDR